MVMTLLEASSICGAALGVAREAVRLRSFDDRSGKRMGEQFETSMQETPAEQDQLGVEKSAKFAE